MVNSNKWVQHISGQGEKHRVSESSGYDNVWRVETAIGGADYYLPKSEYHLCDPPDVWRDVTGECELVRAGYTGEWYTLVHRHANGVQEIIIGSPNHVVTGYRLRKIELWQTNGYDGKNCPVAAFIVEQKVTG